MYVLDLCRLQKHWNWIMKTHKNKISQIKNIKTLHYQLATKPASVNYFPFFVVTLKCNVLTFSVMCSAQQFLFYKKYLNTYIFQPALNFNVYAFIFLNYTGKIQSHTTWPSYQQLRKNSNTHFNNNYLSLTSPG